MATTTVISAHTGYKPSVNLFAGFFKWCDAQEKNRIMWTGISLTTQACLFTPLALVAVMLSGVSVVLLALTVVTIFINLVVNLAAMPARVTIPVFVFSILIDIAVIIAAVSMGIDLAKAF